MKATSVLAGASSKDPHFRAKATNALKSCRACALLPSRNFSTIQHPLSNIRMNATRSFLELCTAFWTSPQGFLLIHNRIFLQVANMVGAVFVSLPSLTAR
jgi:hypothetical protein